MVREGSLNGSWKKTTVFWFTLFFFKWARHKFTVYIQPFTTAFITSERKVSSWRNWLKESLISWKIL